MLSSSLLFTAALFPPIVLTAAHSQGDPLSQRPADGAAPPAPPPLPEEEGPRGLRLRAEGAFDGWTIIAPINSKKVHLVDMDGEVAHTWETQHAPGAWLYLLENGNILRGGRKEEKKRFHGGGIGGILQEIAWDGTVVWEWELASDERMLHHEIDPLPNGNVLVIAWENHSREEAIARGRDEDKALEEGFWPDVVLEVKPVRPKGAEIVWEWRAWDHLVQDRDPKKPGYGALADHPGRIDINADHRYKEKKEESEAEKKKRLELEARMRATGYVGGDPADDDPKAHAGAAQDGKDGGDAKADGGANGKGDDGAKDPPDGKGAPPGPPKPSGDWLHTNSVDWLPGEDLIVLSTPHLCELWVIDHSTTTNEAAGSTGGRRAKGGEILWRWGNPQNYGRGARADRKLFYQHDPSWLPGEKPGELRLLVFNNGRERPGKEHSSVEELVLPFERERGFARAKDAPFGPPEPAWSYTDPENFLSEFISGAQRLPNGNTLICSGKDGRVFEVTRAGRVVWDYLSPLGGEIEPSPHGGRAPPKALFRAVRVPKDHPGLKGRM